MPIMISMCTQQKLQVAAGSRQIVMREQSKKEEIELSKLNFFPNVVMCEKTQMHTVIGLLDYCKQMIETVVHISGFHCRKLTVLSVMI